MRIYSRHSRIHSNSLRDSLPLPQLIEVTEKARNAISAFNQVERTRDDLSRQLNKLKPRLPLKPLPPPHKPSVPDRKKIPLGTIISSVVIGMICGVGGGNNDMLVLSIFVGVSLSILTVLYIKNWVVYLASKEKIMTEYHNKVSSTNIENEHRIHTNREIDIWNKNLKENREKIISKISEAQAHCDEASQNLRKYVINYGFTYTSDIHEIRAVPWEVLNSILYYLKNGTADSISDALYLCECDTEDPYVYEGLLIDIPNRQLYENAITNEIQKQDAFDDRQIEQKKQEHQEAALHDAQAKQQEDLEHIQKDLDNIDLLQTLAYIERTKNNS